MNIPSAAYQRWQSVASSQPDPDGTTAAPLILSSQDKQKINSTTPVPILSGTLRLAAPAQLLITGQVSGTCTGVFGLVVTVNGTPVSPAKETNRCHPDCCVTVHGNGKDSFQQIVPVHLITEEYPAGTYEVVLSALSAWQGEAKPTWINDRKGGNMSGQSSLRVEPL